MNIPKTIKIGGFDWVVRFDKDLTSETNSWGLCRNNKQEIVIDPDTTIQNQEESFLHEILHAIYWQVGLKERHDLTEEEIIKGLANTLYQVLKDNNLNFSTK